MAATPETCCRVDYRSVAGGASPLRTGRVALLSATGCTVQSDQPPASPMMELSIDLGDNGVPLRIERAHVMWGDWNGFTVEFLDMPALDQRRLRECLWTMSLQEELRENVSG